jgi:integrase
MLSDSKIRNIKPTDTRKRYADSEGLYIDVLPSGKKTWLFRYTRNGKRHWLSLGEYPMVGLAEAREMRNAAKRQIFDGMAPGTKKTVDFNSISQEWYTRNSSKWSEKTKRITMRRLEMHILPFVGMLDIETIKSADILSIARRIEAKGTAETARRVIQICSQVFRYAIACEYCKYDPTQSIHGALMPASPGHFASLTKPADVALLLRSIDAYPQILVRCAMQFSALVFLRPGEVRHIEWSEIERDEIHLPEEKMKKKLPHIVPLSTQTINLLEKIRMISGHGKYVFPSSRTLNGNRPMSENTVLAALRSLGYTNPLFPTAYAGRSTPEISAIPLTRFLSPFKAYSRFLFALAAFLIYSQR